MNRIVIDGLPVGSISIVEEGGRIVSLKFADEGAQGCVSPVLIDAQKQVRAYFAGTLRRFDLPIRLQTSPFRTLIYQALVQVPYGETISYGQLAEKIGRPRAVRAVGQALKQNPIWLILPCHRVIGKNGSLTGFAGGLDAKAMLLALEQENMEESK